MNDLSNLCRSILIDSARATALEAGLPDPLPEKINQAIRREEDESDLAERLRWEADERADARLYGRED